MAGKRVKTKEQQRKKMLAKRASLESGVRKRKSVNIKEQLFNQSEFKTAQRIMFYVAFKNEVETKQMIKETLRQGKEVIVPITDKQNKRLYLSQLKDYDQELIIGTYGIKEPAKEYYRPVAPTSLELIVVPGVAFDHQGHRLGYGGGYYDRLLGSIPAIPRLAISFELQIIDNVITDQHDKKLAKIITENRVISC